MRSLDVHTVAASWHQELWVPAEELEEFNANILGRIEVIAQYRGGEGGEPQEVAASSVGSGRPTHDGLSCAGARARTQRLEPSRSRSPISHRLSAPHPRSGW